MDRITTTKLTPLGLRILEGMGHRQVVGVTALARTAGIRRQTLYRMLTQRTRVSAQDLFLVADALQVPPRWLLDGTQEQAAAPQRPTPTAESAPSVRADAPAGGPVPLYDGFAASRWEWCPWQPKVSLPFKAESKEGPQWQFRV